MRRNVRVYYLSCWSDSCRRHHAFFLILVVLSTTFIIVYTASIVLFVHPSAHGKARQGFGSHAFLCSRQMLDEVNIFLRFDWLINSASSTLNFLRLQFPDIPGRARCLTAVMGPRLPSTWLQLDSHSHETAKTKVVRVESNPVKSRINPGLIQIYPVEIRINPFKKYEKKI